MKIRPPFKKGDVINFPLRSIIADAIPPVARGKIVSAGTRYASAVHARWVRADGTTAINAVAVASEPEIFWRGTGASEIIAGIPIPEGAGQLLPASGQINGPSGIALDDCFLTPLGLSMNQAWLCDLLPESCCNPKQEEALKREYEPMMKDWGLPPFHFPTVPAVLADANRRKEIEQEITEAQSDVLITLGDQPLMWFTKHYGSKSRLATYGESPDTYGRLHEIEISGRKMNILPLAHPRQAGKLGSHSPKWYDLHRHWMQCVAPSLMKEVAGFDL